MVKYVRTLTCLLALTAAAQSVPTFSVTSDLVILDVSVLHKRTKTAVSSLQKEDFMVFEDGVPQNVAFCSRDQLPLSIVLIFDITQSVWPVIGRLSRSGLDVLNHLKSEDEIAVMVCAAAAVLVDGFTTDRQRTIAAIADAATRRSNEAAFFNEAMYQAARLTATTRNTASRRVVIWFTDGLPNIPTAWEHATLGRSVPKGQLHTEAQAFQMLHEAGVAITPMILESPLTYPFWVIAMLHSGPPTRSNPPGNPHKYAELTGGQLFHVRLKNVQERLSELITDLRSRYAIGYRPSQSRPAGTYCRVRVELSSNAPLRPKEWSVLVRDGYYRK